MVLVALVLPSLALVLIPLLALVLLKSAHSTVTDRNGAGAKSTGAGTFIFACIAQKLAPAGKK